MFKYKIRFFTLVVFLVSCISLCAQIETADSLNDHFYFVQITDTHVGTENNLKIIQEIVE